MEKEKWISQIMESTNGKADAAPPAGFEQKLFADINKPQAGAKVISIKWVAAAACAACLLLIANISVLSSWGSYTKEESINTATTTASINSSITDELSPSYNFFQEQ